VISPSQGRHLTQISMLRVGFEPTIPAFERVKTVHTSDHAATVIGRSVLYLMLNILTKEIPLTELLMMIAQMVKKFLTFYGTGMVITVFKKPDSGLCRRYISAPSNG
jgi:hypothetical protein